MRDDACVRKVHPHSTERPSSDHQCWEEFTSAYVGDDEGNDESRSRSGIPPRNERKEADAREEADCRTGQR